MTASELHRIMVEKGELTERTQVTVSGIVGYIGPDMYGQPSVELSDQAKGKALILCVVSRTDQNKVTKGETVIVSGECLGYTHGYVVIKKCNVLQK